ncbi:helix-turn-helix transcriptional regulator [Streptomyces sp. 71268]|nr:helix-turn-helix transcriptional regulator [Streptomyces sp. 71268]WEV25634.1 helix-turn-helix transcriptional regulator [Streptomyces sp. 71268]
MKVRRGRFARQRRACGYSQESLADALGVDRTSIGRWERGESDPRPFLLPKLAALLRVTLLELDALLQRDAITVAPVPRTKDGDLDDVIRRDFLQMVTTATMLSDLGALGEAPDDEHTYQSMNDHLWRLHARAQSRSPLFPLVHSQIAELTSALDGAGSESVRRQLCGEAAELFQLAGEVLFDCGKYTDAAHCYTLAASAAKEVDSPDLWACALTRYAFIRLYADHDSGKAVQLLDHAAALAQRGDSSLSTRHWVAAVQAEAYAATGDVDSCQRALDRAVEVHALRGDSRNRGWLRFDGSRLAEQRATCYVRLRRFDLAEPVLGEVLQKKLSTRRQSSVLTDLAMVGAQRGDVDQVVDCARQAVTLAQRNASSYTVCRLRTLQPTLMHFRADPRVRDLSVHIDELNTTAPQSRGGAL